LLRRFAPRNDDGKYRSPDGAQRNPGEGAELALRMQRCGVSRWHPDPARECDRIEAEQRQQSKIAN